MMGVNIIKGKVALGARLIASRVMAHGYSFKVRYLENDGAEIEFFGKDKSSLGVSSFKRADAEAAGLLGDMYKKYARNMYYARAMSNGANWYTPDVFGGAPVYTPEELGAHVDGEGEIISAPAETPGQVLSRRLTEERGNLAKLEATEELPAKPWTTFKEMLDLFATAKAAVGDAQYYRCLQAHGVEHANGLKGKGVAAALACYTELLDLAETLGNVETEPA